MGNVIRHQLRVSVDRFFPYSNTPVGAREPGRSGGQVKEGGQQMIETEQAMMALLRGVVALSEATRALAANGSADFVQLAALKAKTAEISASIARLQPSEPEQLQVGEVPEPMATSASYRPTKTVSSLDDFFDDL